MTNTNHTKISHIFFGSNSPSNYSIISQYNKVIYIKDIIYKARFISFANIFVTQLYNSPNIKIDRLYIIQSIIYKLEL